MAFDGITTAALCAELNNKLTGGRISKVAQPEPDELQILVNTSEGNYRLLLSAEPSLPLVYITEQNKKSPSDEVKSKSGEQEISLECSEFLHGTS